MAYTLIVHIANSEAIIGEVDELPTCSDTMIMVSNPRRTDGKDLHYISENVTTVFWPIDRINFIEVFGSESDDEIIGFVKE